jgi:hypothetical protein
VATSCSGPSTSARTSGPSASTRCAATSAPAASSPPRDVAVLERELARAGDRWVVVVTHEPLARTPGADAVLARLDRHPRTLAALAGSVHRASVTPRRAPNGGWWLLTTPSIADFPMQARMLRVREAARGGALLDTWLLDLAPGGLPDVARELAFLDAQGGRPRGPAREARRPQRHTGAARAPIRCPTTLSTRCTAGHRHERHRPACPSGITHTGSSATQTPSTRSNWSSAESASPVAPPRCVPGADPEAGA